MSPWEKIVAYERLAVVREVISIDTGTCELGAGKCFPHYFSIVSVIFSGGENNRRVPVEVGCVVVLLT